jgi:hypothetical protein
MAEATSVRAPGGRELVLALCAAWLLMQNVLLLLWIGWQPLAGVRIAAVTLARVVLHVAGSAAGVLDIARLLIAAGTGASHV